MRRTHVILVTCIVSQVGASFALSAHRPHRSGSKPIVVLLPEIEELEETQPETQNTEHRKTSKGVARVAPQPLFPAARQYFRNLTGASTRSPSSVSDPVAGAPATAGSAVLEFPPHSGQKIVPASAAQFQPVPTPVAEPLYHQELILPEELREPSSSVTPYAGLSSPDICDQHWNSEQPVAEEPPLTITPKSQKFGARWRFPQLSNFFAK